MRALYRSDAEILAWWGARIECESSVARLEREGRLLKRSANAARGRLHRFSETWQEVQPVELVREAALRLLRVHDLRAGDSLQLAAAIAVAEGRPAALPFVCLDMKLGAAAEREGFRVLGPALRR